MRSLIVILIAPLLKDDLRFEQTAEEFAVKALVAQLVVEAFDVAVLPRASRFDVDGFYFILLEPVLNRIGDELGAVVAAQMVGPAVSLEGRLHYGDDIYCPD